MIVLHEIGDIWLQHIPTILKDWRSVDINQKHAGPYDRSWAYHFDELRDDMHYPAIVASMRSEGWLRPLTCAYTYYDGGDRHWYFGDGHHRLMAAIEVFGAEYVPIYRSPTLKSSDSGYWTPGRRVKRCRLKSFLNLPIPPLKELV